ncbi:MAG: TolC family protein [Gammaproteobacteria bacterium]|nr:TolC family protein [Gammaproteobacteria bacterium]
MRHWSGMILGVFYLAASHADSASDPTVTLIPEALATEWLAHDPTILAAHSDLDAARIEAAQFEVSPYEWTSKLTYQERAFRQGTNSHEWNVGLERQVRLPAKQRADVAIATATVAVAKARLGRARRQAAGDLLGGWLDWLTAHAVKTLLMQQQRLAEDNLNAVIKRVKSGDAARLDQRLAAAEVSDIERGAGAAATDEAIAYAKLTSRFMAAGAPLPAPLPEPIPPSHDVPWWQERVRAVSDQLAAARAEQARAEANAARADAERVPDPTLGVYAASEIRGDENIVGGTLSIPFPGERRTLEIRRRLAEVNATRDRLAATEREVEGVARAAYAALEGQHRRWQLASAAAVAMRENAAIAQKAYVLGEQDLQTLLLARRQALSSAEAEQQARAAALRAHYELLLDAKLLWQGADASTAR